METIKKLLDLNKKETLLVILCAFLSGIVIGFFIAPIKKGVYCGNNNGNQLLHGERDEFDDDEVIHFSTSK